ncbi:MAG: hypothetical protein RL481_808 [Pseudomonadota bacterium]|jgi:hypothetical protein
MNFVAAYRDAMGRSANIDDMHAFLSLLDDPDEDIWIGETGDFGIWRQGQEGEEQEMILCYAPEHGFTIQADDAQGQVRIACQGSNRHPVAYEVGGMDASRPRFAFVDAEQAKAIVSEYVCKGTLNEDFDWRPLLDLI